jgi:hypothetical protein
MPAVTSVTNFSDGNVLTATALNAVNCGIHVYSNAAARDAAYGGSGERTLVEGEYAYLLDTNQTLVYDSAAWQAVGNSLTLLSTTTLTGATTAITGIDQTYNNLFITIEKFYASSNAYLRGYLNADSTAANYISLYSRLRVGGSAETSPDTYVLSGWPEGTSQQDNLIALTLPNYTGSSMKIWNSYGYQDTDNGARSTFYGSGSYFSTTAISSITFAPSAGTFSAGTVKIYGVK